MFQSSVLIRATRGLLVILIFFSLTACVYESSNVAVNQNVTATSPVNLLTPFEVAKQSKWDGYKTVMEVLQKKFPNNKELLSDYEQNELFPEMNIGRHFSCNALKSALFLPEWHEKNESFSLNTDTSFNIKDWVDTLAITINWDGTVSLLTQTAFNFWVVDALKLVIKQNDKFGLVTEEANLTDGTHSIILDKNTGLWFWFKGSSSYIESLPGAQLHYIFCPWFKNLTKN